MRIALISPYCPLPAFGGGKSRIYNLYRHIASEGVLVDMVAMEQEVNGERHGEFELAPGFFQTSIPKTDAHRKKDDEVDKKCGAYVYDASLLYHARLSPAFADAAKQAIDKADAVVMEVTPYLYREIEPFIGNKPLFFDAHDVTYNVKLNLLKERREDGFVKKFLQDLYDVEKEVLDRCEKIFVCSQEDVGIMAELFHIDPDKFIVAANGVDASAVPFTPLEKRLANKRKLGLEGEKMGIFLGSAHYPNFEACEHIIAMADRCESWFFLMGSQCNEYRSRQLPGNVGLLGLVSDSQKNAILSVADFSINPVVSGSGSNVKMFDYMAAGLPTIAAGFALRGIEEKQHFLVAEPEQMPEVVNAFRLEEHAARVQAARAYVEAEFDWSVIARQSMLPALRGSFGSFGASRR